jgi:hypothetical protein
VLRWIDTSNVAAIAADNFAVEAVPPARDRRRHGLRALARAMPVKLGMPLGELWYLGRARALAGSARPHALSAHCAAR